MSLNTQIEGWPPNQEKMEELKQAVQEQKRIKEHQEQKKKQELEYVFILPIEGNLKIRDANSHDKSLHIEDILKTANIISIGDLVIRDEDDLLGINGIGLKTLDEIKYALSKGVLWRKNLHLGMQIEDWPPSQEKIEQLIKENQLW